MEQRENARKIRRQQLRARYAAAEASAKAAERMSAIELTIAEAKEIEDKKQQKLTAKKERTLAKMEQQRKREESVARRQLADLHALKARLLYRGMLPWKRLVERARNFTRKADTHYQLGLLERTWRGLEKNLARNKRAQRVLELREEARGRALYHKLLLRRYFYRGWKFLHRFYKARVHFQRKKADIRLLRKMFVRGFKRLHEYFQVRMFQKTALAIGHHRDFSFRNTFRKWRIFVEVSQSETRAMIRQAAMRNKVQGWLSDFTTPQKERASARHKMDEQTESSPSSIAEAYY